MGKPTRHYGRWRIRWTDEAGERHSKVFDDKAEAELELKREELATEERRRVAASVLNGLHHDYRRAA
jgi:hypothetical protein